MNSSKLKLIFPLAVLAGSMFFFSACDKEEGPAPAPGITSFSPESGYEGDELIITGQNFSTTASENIVKFNGTSATVKSATATKLTVTVPEGASSGKITVSVNDQLVTSTKDFTVLPLHSINSFSPEIGVEGDEIVITGENFSTTASENTVEFNGVSATVSEASATSLTVTVPEGATSGKITVTINGKTVTSTEDFIIKVNYALTAVASASSTIGGYSVDNIKDGDTNTTVGGDYSWTNDFYSPDGKLPQWVQLDLGEKKVITRIVLYTSESPHVIQDFQIQYSNGVDWATIESVEGNTEVMNTYTFDAIEARFVRVYATKGSTHQAWFARINELEVWNK